MTPVLLSTLGWVSDMSEALMKALSWAFDLFATLATYLFNFLFSVILQGIVIVCGLFLQKTLLILLRIVDVFQDLFDVFAGTDTVKYQGDEMYLLDVFLTNDGVKRALLVVTFIGVAICFIFTIYSVAKSMGSYVLEHKRPVTEILKTAMKSCISFMIVPVIIYFGSQLSSAILISTEKAILGITGSDDAPKLSTILFLTGTFGDDDEQNASFTTGVRAEYFTGVDGKGAEKSIYNIGDINADFCMYPKLDLDNIKAVFQSQAEDYDVSGKAIIEITSTKESTETAETTEEIGFSLDNLKANTKTFSNFFENTYNYLLVYIASIGVILILLCSMFVFIRKIIDILILYVTSPLFVASMPLDGGNIFRKWRQLFIGKMFSGFGIVISMNLVMIFIPMIMSSSFSFSDVIALDLTMKIIFVVGCMYAAWKSNATLLEVINPEVAAADRASAAVMAGMVKMAADTAKQAAMATMTGGTSVAAKGAATAAKGASAAANGASGAANAASGAAKGSGNAFTGGVGGAGGGGGQGAMNGIKKFGQEAAKSSGNSGKKDDEESDPDKKK